MMNDIQNLQICMKINTLKTFCMLAYHIVSMNVYVQESSYELSLTEQYLKRLTFLNGAITVESKI